MPAFLADPDGRTVQGGRSSDSQEDVVPSLGGRASSAQSDPPTISQSGRGSSAQTYTPLSFGRPSSAQSFITPSFGRASDGQSDVVPVHGRAAGAQSDTIPVHGRAGHVSSDVVPVHGRSAGSQSDVVPVFGRSSGPNSDVIPAFGRASGPNSDVVPAFGRSSNGQSDVDEISATVLAVTPDAFAQTQVANGVHPNHVRCAYDWRGSWYIAYRAMYGEVLVNRYGEDDMPDANNPLPDSGGVGGLISDDVPIGFWAHDENVHCLELNFVVDGAVRRFRSYDSAYTWLETPF